MDDIKRELEELITVLNTECDVLKKVPAKHQKETSEFIAATNSKTTEKILDPFSSSDAKYDPRLELSDSVLENAPRILSSDPEPWRYYSPPIEHEHDHDPLRAVLEAGRHTVEAERLLGTDNELGAWRSLALARGALLKSLSADGKTRAKKIGHSNGGQAGRNGEAQYRIFCIADDFLSAGQKWRGLATKVSEKLSEEGIEKSDNQVRDILNEEKMKRPLLVDRRIHHIASALRTSDHSEGEFVQLVVSQLKSEGIEETDVYVRQKLEPF